MKSALVQTFILLCLNCASQTFPSDPDKARIFSKDVEEFWIAFDKLLADTGSNPFEEYLRNGSIGLKDFIPDRIVSAAELRKLVLSESDYYKKIKPSSLKAAEFDKRIRAAYYSLKYLYPKAVFPPVYFVIGRTTSGGTASEHGLIIGVENFSDTLFKTNYGRPSFKLGYIPDVVAHEIIHFLQKDNKTDSTLLKECIREGSADFIAELTAGSDIKKLNGDDVYPYGDKNEMQLWKEFKDVTGKSDYGPWLYSPTKDKRPQNLGYWMGYKIVEAYYNKSIDKKKAIDDILNIQDYKKFLAASGYEEKLEKISKRNQNGQK